MSGPEKSECIEHAAIVEECKDNYVLVKISSVSACSSCHAEGTCLMMDRKEKVISVNGSYNYSRGDAVTVLMHQSAGYKALFLGYILPFLLVMCLLIISVQSSLSELFAGLVSVGILAPYYGLLWLLRKRIGRNFTFTLKT